MVQLCTCIKYVDYGKNQSEHVGFYSLSFSFLSPSMRSLISPLCRFHFTVILPDQWKHHASVPFHLSLLWVHYDCFILTVAFIFIYLLLHFRCKFFSSWKKKNSLLLVLCISTHLPYTFPHFVVLQYNLGCELVLLYLSCIYTNVIINVILKLAKWFTKKKRERKKRIQPYRCESLYLVPKKSHDFISFVCLVFKT